MQNLLDNIKLVKATSDQITTAKSTLFGLAIDTVGYDGCMFLIVGTSGTGVPGATYCAWSVQGAAASNGTWYTFSTHTGSDLRLKTTKPTAANNDYTLGAIDVIDPQYRWLRLRNRNTTGGTAGVAVLYNPRHPGATEWMGSTQLFGTTKLVGIISTSTAP